MISLDEHLKQLRILYEEANKYVFIEPLIPEILGMDALRKRIQNFPNKVIMIFSGK